MRSACADELLALWESAASREGPERALRLLAFALPGETYDALAELDLGLRDWHLLRLRRVLFGSVISAYVDCPHCDERLELQLDVRDLQDELPPLPPPVYQSREGTCYRLPNTRDLVTVRDAGDEIQAERLLLRCCCMEQAWSEADAGADIDDSLLDEVDSGLEQIAAARSARIALQCARCESRCEFPVDAGQLLWEELHARAVALIDEVDRLAVAYGWSESEILALSEKRRAAYLKRVL